MKKTRIFADNYSVNYRFEEKFELVYHHNAKIPFLFLRNSFENNFYYFHRFKISISDLEFFPFKAQEHKLKIGIIANSFEDMKLSPRLVRDFDLLDSKHTQVFVIPVGYDWNLTAEEANWYRSFTANFFDLLISLGGDDLHPQLYNQKNSLARNVNFDRDLSEYRLVKHFKENSTGVFLGICRGHQLSAVVDGYQLVQDLSEINEVCLNRHQKVIEDKPEYLFHEITLMPSLISRLFGFKDQLVRKVIVNSFHHQAVQKCENIKDHCVAYDSEHEIIEALVSRNNRSISVQFHPELPNEINKNIEFTELGNKFIQRVVCYSRLNRSKKTSIKSNLPLSDDHQDFQIPSLKVHNSK